MKTKRNDKKTDGNKTPEASLGQALVREAARLLQHSARPALPASLGQAMVRGLAGLSDEQSWELLADYGPQYSTKLDDAARALHKYADRYADTVTKRLKVMLECMWDGDLLVAPQDDGKWNPRALKLWTRLGVDLKAEEVQAAAGAFQSWAHGHAENALKAEEVQAAAGAFQSWAHGHAENALKAEEVQAAAGAGGGARRGGKVEAEKGRPGTEWTSSSLYRTKGTKGTEDAATAAASTTNNKKNK